MLNGNNNIVVLHGVNVVNAGDLGIIHATIQQLVEVIPGANIKILSPFKKFGEGWKNKSKHSRDIDVSSWGAEEVADFYEVPIANKIKKLQFIINFIALLLFSKIDGALFNYYFSKKHDVLKYYANADIIISKGGGFLHDRTGMSGIPPHIFSMLLALNYNAPLVIYAQSVGPYKGKIGKIFTKYVLNRASLLLIREDESIKYIRNELDVTNRNIYLTADEAFLLKPIDVAEVGAILNKYGISSDLPIIGLALCNWGFPNSRNPELAKDTYIKETAKTIDSLVEKFGAQCLIACHVENDGVDDDRSVSEKVLDNVARKDKVYLLDTYNDTQIKGIWARCDLFVGTRMHSNIFALGGSVPTIAISYLHKTDGIMRGLGLGDWVLKIDEFTSDDVIKLAERVLVNKELTKEIISKRVEDIKNKARLNSIKVRELLVANGSEI